ncbi:SdpA family antimicrobial peptide system protein [Aureispira anguillae]|uniref:SdpA family antimicrobial peptide system protein n=1 Tax=Aureispira anguillae TaxID=2864201 RepID=A0A915YL07_9BACT|nr:SdpA family antimicrobial peptide system protein [Aureispira anguillae]BDS15148.1 SdpA family antimicrobial peptide system protein [Aureispira anguillae]
MKKHLLMGLAIVTIFSYFYFNFISTLSQNVISITAEEKNIIKFFFPQGWGFFTKDPREAKYKLYDVTDPNAPKLVNFKITALENFFGLSRKGNRICIEMIRIQNHLPKDSKWVVSNLDIDEFHLNESAFESIDLGQEDFFYIKSGKYIIKKYFITPWNWLKYPNNYSKEYKYYSFELN